jgi:phytoene dehydrogenase-like protein
MAGLLRELGGEVVTGRRIDRLSDVADADIVILDTAPEFAADLLGTATPPRIGRALRSIPHRTAAFKVDYVIDGEVGWTAPGCDRAGTVHLGGTSAQIADAEQSVLRGRMPRRPFVLVGQQWLADPGRASGSLRPLWAYAHVPNGYRGPVTELVTAQIERFAPGFADRIVDVRARTPDELEMDNPNYVRGDIGGGPNDLLHLVARPRPTSTPYATGVPGVYLCSSATPPGGGVHGMCGFHAAQTALDHLITRA